MHNTASTRAISYRALLPFAQCSKAFNFGLVVSSTIEYMPSDLLEERAKSLCSLRACTNLFPLAHIADVHSYNKTPDSVRLRSRSP